MIRTVVTGALAALALSALPAAAQDWRDDYRGEYRDDRRDRDDRRYRDQRPQSITVHSDRGSFTAHRGDRLYRRLTGNPFKFKPGRIYEYRDCYRRSCDVLVIDPYGRQRYDRITAPPIDYALGRGRY